MTIQIIIWNPQIAHPNNEINTDSFAPLISHSHRAAAPLRNTWRQHLGNTQDHQGSRELKAALTVFENRGKARARFFLTLAIMA